MSKMNPVLLPVLVAATVGLALAHAQSQPTSNASQSDGTKQTQSPTSTADVLATVNGTPLREADVRFALRKNRYEGEITPEQRKNILAVLIQRELISQRAVELGLDANASYQEKLRQMEAQVEAFKRNELADLFYRREIAQKAEVNETEAKAYFTENAGRIRTELHVWQILRRDDRSIERIRNDLEHGMSFEEVAGKRFRQLPKMERAPWDLGYLKWTQVPESWRDIIYTIKMGETSGIIRGPNSRFWIIKLIDKRKNPDVTFESIKPTIIAVLKKERIEELRQRTDRDLRARANIAYWNTDD